MPRPALSSSLGSELALHRLLVHEVTLRIPLAAMATADTTLTQANQVTQVTQVNAESRAFSGDQAPCRLFIHKPLIACPESNRIQ